MTASMPLVGLCCFVCCRRIALPLQAWAVGILHLHLRLPFVSSLLAGAI